MERVATVGGHPIPVWRVDERMERLRHGPRGRHVPPDGSDASVRVRRWLVQELIAEEIVAQEARRMLAWHAPAGTVPGPDVVRRVRDLVTADVMLAEDDIRGYYDRNRDLYARTEMRRVRHVLAADERPARAAARTLAARRPDPLPGEPLEVRRGELAGDLEDAIFAAAVGDVVGPFRTEHGWHVALVEGIVAAHLVPYHEVRDAIAEGLLDAARDRAFGDRLDRRRRELAVIEPHFEHPGHPIHGLPRHRH